MSCGFAEETVAYLYGEITEGERARYEAHLAKCVFCTDELAEFSAVRFSIRDWRADEFSDLPTPAFVLPTGKVEARSHHPWRESIRAYFSFSPRLAAAASFAVLAVFAALAIILYKPTGDRNIAENFNQNSIKPITSPTAETPPRAPENSKEETARNAAGTEASRTVKVSPNEKTAPTKIALPAKSDRQAAVETKNTNPVKVERNDKSKPQKDSQKPQLPDLRDADEDDSLRLADILEEISMR